MTDSMQPWDYFMVDVLRALQDGQTRGLTDVRNTVAEQSGLTLDQRVELLPSGQSRAENRIGWAISFLTRVGALERPARAKYRITPVGAQILAEHPNLITETVLKGYARPGDEWWKVVGGDPPEPPIGPGELDPVEQIEQGLQRIQSNVAAELLTRLTGREPAFFEAAVVKLLVAMGFGGTDGKATVTQLTNDGGIDGIIDRDALGLDRVYIQAKRYQIDRTVQAPEVQAFVGALSGKATSGIFITTGRFTKGAIDFAASAHTRIILVDGSRLTELMIRYSVGVQTKQTLHIVAVDEDFFA